MVKIKLYKIMLLSFKLIKFFLQPITENYSNTERKCDFRSY